ncbi:MAG: cell division protein FtsZ [Burkholderiales bacterium PBB4]|nr:MAG: cell division protein FtsZ [Burkholderiales bacterium PBB4]
MSDLQIGLAVAGGFVLAAFVAHGAWTTRKNTPKQATLEDVEPGMVDAGGDTVPLVVTADTPAFNLPAAPKRPLLDSLIDVIASITLDTSVHAVSGEAAWAAMPVTRRAGNKPFAIEGFNQVGRVWEVPSPGQRYIAFQAGVQLANRSGALNEIEYSEFVVKTQAFADAVNGSPEFPEMLEEVARARELDQFASAHDAQLSFTIRARNASWSPGYIHQNAAKLGFVAGAIPGRLVLPASEEGLPPMLVLSFDSQAALAEDPAQSAIRRFALHLDVAQVGRSEQAFERMRSCAMAMAQAMEGLITDDNGQALAVQSMDVIGAELQGLYDILEQRDLAAGSALARRLFS